MYVHTNTIRHLFKEVKKVKQVTDFWRFMEKDFINGVYPEEWYHTGTSQSFLCPNYKSPNGKVHQEKPYTKKCQLKRKLILTHFKILGIPCEIDFKDRMVLHANRLLGAPRLRLLRVRNDSCMVPKEFQANINVNI